MAGVGFPLILASNAFAQLPAPAVPADPAAPPPSTAEVERVIVTGSNIPTAEETARTPWTPTVRRTLRNWASATPRPAANYSAAAGGTVNLNIGNGGDGTSSSTCAVLLPKETGSLMASVAYGSLGPAGFSGADINLIPFR
jgi:hypothetical protein